MQEIKATLHDTLSLVKLCTSISDFARSNGYVFGGGFNHSYFAKQNEKDGPVEVAIDIPRDMPNKRKGTFDILIKKSFRYLTQLVKTMENFVYEDNLRLCEDMLYIFNCPIEPFKKDVKPAFFKILYDITVRENVWPIFPRVPSHYREEKNDDGEIFTFWHTAAFHDKQKKDLLGILEKYYGEPLVIDGNIKVPPKKAPFVVAALNYAPRGVSNILVDMFGSGSLEERIKEVFNEVKKYPDVWHGQSLFGKHQNNVTQVCKVRPWGDPRASLDFCEVHWNNYNQYTIKKPELEKSKLQ